MLSQPRHKVAYFDDDSLNLKVYAQMLAEEFLVDTYQNPLVYTQALQEDYSAILIDVHMPVMDGFDLYQNILKHSSYNGCPLFFISASDEIEVRYRSLSNGAYDFLQRLMKREELIARLKNGVRNFQLNRTTYSLGNLRMGVEGFQIFVQGQMIEVTMMEFKILWILMKKYPEMVDREELIHQIWPSQKPLSHSINTHLSNLRTKLVDWDHEVLTLKTKGLEIRPKKRVPKDPL